MTHLAVLSIGVLLLVLPLMALWGRVTVVAHSCYTWLVRVVSWVRKIELGYLRRLAI